MTVTVLPQGTEPGQWNRLRINGDESVRVRCEPCGTVIYLDDHRIAADGEVAPEMHCPRREDCGWHVMGKLEGWAG
jgi:hypothetical protein